MTSAISGVAELKNELLFHEHDRRDISEQMYYKKYLNSTYISTVIFKQ